MIYLYKFKCKKVGIMFVPIYYKDTFTIDEMCLFFIIYSYEETAIASDFTISGNNKCIG